jgi:hypothetical protein
MNPQILFSLLTFGHQLNITQGNQGDHCIVAAASGQVIVENQVLGGSGEECQQTYGAFALRLLTWLGNLGVVDPVTLRGII